MLVFESQPRLKVVVLCLMAYHQFRTFHICVEFVACMLKVCSHAKILGCLSLCQPVLPLKVVSFALCSLEGRPEKRYGSVVSNVARDSK